MAEFLTREQILAAQGFKTEEEEVPEWGGSVLVRSLSALEVIDLGVGVAGEDGMDIAKAITLFPKIVSFVVVNEDGDPLLNEDDVKQLGGKSIGVMRRIVEKTLRLSGLGDEEDDTKNA